MNATAAPPPVARIALAQLFADLRREGFRLRPDDYVEVQRVLEAFTPQSPDDVRALVAPLLVTSAAEQEKFDRIFAASFREIQLPAPPVKPPPPPRRVPWAWLGGGLLLLGLLAYGAFFWPAPVVKPGVALRGNVGPFQVGDSLRFVVDSSMRRAAGRQLGWRWQTSDGQTFPDCTEIAVVARRAGNLTVAVTARPRRGLLFPTDETPQTASLRLPVCAGLPALKLDSLRLPGQRAGEVRYRYTVTRLKPTQPVQSLVWLVNGSTVARDVPALTYTHRQSPVVSAYDVRVQAFPNTTRGLCFGEASLSVTIPGTNETPFTLTARPAGGAIQPATRVKAPFRWATWLLGLVAAMATGLYFRLVFKDFRKRQATPPPSDSGDENPLARFVSDEPPLEIPFQNRETTLIVRDEAFHQVVRTLRQRMEEETTRLHVPGTLRATLREGGFPTLVFQPRLAEVEFLFLIDRSQVRSQQVALFEYLFRAFSRENVGIERFFFHQNFDRFTNETHPGGFTLRQLTDTYRSRTLVVWSKGYPLLYPAYPVVEPAYREALAEFAQRAVLTPVAFADWGQKERALQDFFLLLPADLAGQVRLMRALAEGKTHQDAYLRQQAADFYEAEDVDFRDLDELAAYLADEGLVQWLGAVALYPRLRWEVVVEMGRAILPPERVNFSNLLKLVRIRWMHEGSLPDRTRLDLLKRLTPENEAKARETLLRMLEHAEQYFPGERLFGEEKYLLQTTNRFTLYARDAQRYADFAPALKEFRTLRDKKLLPDRTMARYLENDGRQWDTALNQRPKPDLALERLEREITELEAEEARLRTESEAAFQRGEEERTSSLTVSRKAVQEQLAVAKRTLANRRAERQPRRTTLDGYFASLPADEPAPPPARIPRDPRRLPLLVTALGLLLAWVGVWLFTQTSRARELVPNQQIPLTVALDPGACVTARNTSATDGPRWWVYVNDSLYSLSNLHATRSFSLASLLNASGSTGGGWGDETPVSGLQDWFRRTFEPVQTDSLRLFATVAVRDTASAATQYQQVALTGDTLRVGIACPENGPKSTKPDSSASHPPAAIRLRVDVFYSEENQAITQRIARKLAQGLQTSAQYDVQVKLLRTRVNQSTGYRVGSNEIRAETNERTQASALKTAAEAILRTEKITFSLRGVTSSNRTPNYVSLFIVNSPAAGKPFVCQPVSTTWLSRFNGANVNSRRYTNLLTAQGTSVKFEMEDIGRPTTLAGTVRRICQQKGVYLVLLNGSNRALLVRPTGETSVDLATIDLNPTNLDAADGQAYFDKLLAGAAFIPHSVPAKTASEIPAQNKAELAYPPTTAPTQQYLQSVTLTDWKVAEEEFMKLRQRLEKNPKETLIITVRSAIKTDYSKVQKLFSELSQRVTMYDTGLNTGSEQSAPRNYADVYLVAPSNKAK